MNSTPGFARFSSFFTHDGESFESQRKRLLIVWFVILGTLYTGIYAVSNFMRGLYPYMVADLIAVVSGLTLLIFLKKSLHPIWSYRIVILLTGVLLAYLAMESDAQNGMYLWSFIFPILAYYVFGKIEGSAWNLAMVLALIAVLYVVPVVRGTPFLDGPVVGRLFGAYILIGIFAFVFEAVRQRFAKKLLEQQELLSKEKERLENANREIRRLSMTDALTGAYNRAFLNDRLPFEIRRANRYSRPLSIIMADIDHFKAINDTYGHAAGDFVLKEVVRLALECTRTGVDWIARYGGEEFVIVLPETDSGGAIAAAERLRNVLREANFEFDHSSIRLTSSFGIGGFCADDEIANTDEGYALLKQADERLYEAKNRGRDMTVGPT